jgi:hypothetical protein
LVGKPEGKRLRGRVSADEMILVYMPIRAEDIKLFLIA